MRALLIALGVVVLVMAFTTVLPRTTKKIPARTNAPTFSIQQPIIRATDPKRGNPNAPVVLYEFSDFACPACHDAQPIIREALQQFPGKILHVWKDFPLPIHQNALPMHIAAQCANDQGKFWEYHDALFAEPPYANRDFIATARTLGLNTAQFTACQNDATLQERVRKSFAEGQLLHVDQTPYFFINSKRVTDIQNPEYLTATIKKYVP